MCHRLPLHMLVLMSSAWAGQADEPKSQATAQEKKLLDLTNAERKKEELPPLKLNPTLMKLARAHSKNMAKQAKMEHTLDDKSPRDRIIDAKYQFRNFGENIAYELGDIDMPAVMKGWMDSPGHRKNIMNKDFTEIGLSLATNEKGETYYTQVFARPR